MSPAVAAVLAAVVGAGVWMLVAGLRPAPPAPARPTSAGVLRRMWSARGGTGFTLAVGLLGGILAALLTGWVIAVPLGPLAALGVPHLLSRGGAVSVARLDAMAEWTRTLAGVLTVGVGLEQAVLATMRSCPDPIQPEVEHLATRLRARWDTEAALRAFADDLDDATGDLICSALILGARRRGGGLAAILNGLAASVGDEVRVRRQIEADRSKPRTTARAVTVITLLVLALLAVGSDYMAPYGSPFGQLMLGVLLACFAGALLWLRQVAVGRSLPRFLGQGAQR